MQFGLARWENHDAGFLDIAILSVHGLIPASGNFFIYSEDKVFTAKDEVFINVMQYSKSQCFHVLMHYRVMAPEIRDDWLNIPEI